MRLSKYKETKDGNFERKVYKLESLIFCRNSKLRMFLRRLLRKI